MTFPVVKAVAQTLFHVPGLTVYGSKPAREIAKGGAQVADSLRGSLRDFAAAVAYAPNQVFIGSMTPEELAERPRPWYDHPLARALRQGPLGEIMPEEEFLGLLKITDAFELVQLEAGLTARIRDSLAGHSLITGLDLERLGEGVPAEAVAAAVAAGEAIPLSLRDGQVVGCLRHGHEEDENLRAPVLLENLAAKASAVLALRKLLHDPQAVAPAEVDYIINSGEEAVGDRYQRGAGNLAKAVGEACGCLNATGADVAAFCCAPVHALVMAGALVQAGIFRHVAVVGGGALAKLAMKFQGHLARGIPVMEDLLASFAILIGPDDGQHPVLRLDSVGRHPISSAASAEAIYDALVVQPLQRRGLRLTDVDRYAVELHNPEVTDTAGSGDVPRTNYRMLAFMAVRRGDIPRSAVDDFVAQRGMPGFSPTQGHVPAGIPYLGHALAGLAAGSLHNAMFVAKGSLFLGMMTQLSDGMSILVERNPRRAL